MPEAPGSDAARKRGCTCPTEQPPAQDKRVCVMLGCPLHAPNPLEFEHA